MLTIKVLMNSRKFKRKFKFNLNIHFLDSQECSLSQTRGKKVWFVREPKPLPNIKYEAMSQSLKQKGYKHKCKIHYPAIELEL